MHLNLENIKRLKFEFIILLYKIMNVYNMLLLVVFNCIHVLVEVMITLIIFVTLIFTLMNMVFCLAYDHANC